MASEKNSGGAAHSNDGSSAASNIDPNDPLGYGVYAKTLWDRIEHALNRDPHNGELGDDPLVVGLFGEWGVGKSYLLDKIHALATQRQKKLAARRRLDGGFDLLIPVSFQPWKYEHEDHLHVPILLHVLAALEAGIGESLTFWETAAGKVQKPGDAVIKAMPRAVSLLKKAVFGTAAALDPTTTVAVASTQVLADHAAAAADKRAASKNPPTTSALKYTGDGRYYYEIHKILKAVCRPGKYPDLQGHKLLNDVFRVNFVIFVDDLDRCLPERAVAVLELIKTIFNVESFAFVLALDDEVIERGIGHRYREYQLADKKSQMPITGFEYLEKIVHLPFRLPALTREDALRFIEVKERKLLAAAATMQEVRYAPRAWFGPIETLTPGLRVGSAAAFEGVDVKSVLNLAHLVINAFDAYVPRKLDRVVELFHQVAKVAHERGRPLTVELGVAVDARIVLSLVMIQLFQPELFRCLRRTGTGFDHLRDSFKDGSLASDASDFELLDWACMGELRFQVALQRHSEDVKSAPGAPPATPARDPLPVNLDAAMKVLSNVDKTFRHASQRVRLPIVERLLEHRSTQRHVFDALKLFAALATSDKEIPLSTASTKHYYSLLALNPMVDTADSLPLLQDLSADASPRDDAATDKGAPVKPSPQAVTNATAGGPKVIPDPVVGREATNLRSRLPEIAAVFNALTQFEPREQAEVANRAGLKSGQIIDTRDAIELRSRAEQWLRESGVSLGEKQSKQILLRGLQFLAPHFEPDDARSFWMLVADAFDLPSQVGEPVEKPAFAALYGDVCTALHSDARFDDEKPHQWATRFLGENSEPIPGYVGVPAGPYTMGDGRDADNPPRKVSIAHPFYIARTLTTVAQYAKFVDAGGYKMGEFVWSAQGLDWRSGQFESKVRSKDYKHWLSRRMSHLRTVPWDWAAQREHPNRPVTGVTWFEARAYTRWLNAQMRTDIDALPALQNYSVMLPTEDQWERAARARDLTSADARRWPWVGDDEKDVPQRANVSGSGIESVSAVGVFAPNPIGLFDMAGNAWEWMDNLDADAKAGFARVGTDRELKTHADLDKCDLPALRGGSWFGLPVDASCSFRNRSHPDNWRDRVGFRVVLSLASSSEA